MKRAALLVALMLAACFGSESTDTPPESLDEDTGSFVYLTTDHSLTIVDVDRQRVTVNPLQELASGDPQYRLVRRGDVLAAYGQTSIGPAVFVIDPDRPEQPTLLDEAWFFVPSTHEERVWLAILDDASPDTVRALAAVREVTLDGTATIADVRPPDGSWPVGAVADGLMFQSDTDLALWDPVSRSLVDSFPGPFPVATWNNRLVTCAACDEVHLIDLDTGQSRTIDIPEDVGAVDGYGGAFSPDGRYVAVPAARLNDGVTSNSPVGVVIIDFDLATTTFVPGTRQSSWDYPRVAWNSDGEWLFFSNGDQLLAYRPGDDSARTVAVELDGPYYGLAAR
ncbi:MAG: hypothetical protein WD651_04735 [Acidimicrobiia bacterium]